MGFLGPGGLTKSGSDGIMQAKTTTTPYISDTFSDTIGHTHSIVNNSLSIHITHIYFLLHLI